MYVGTYVLCVNARFVVIHFLKKSFLETLDEKFFDFLRKLNNTIHKIFCGDA